jgi:fructan beta-fructosidase
MSESRQSIPMLAATLMLTFAWAVTAVAQARSFDEPLRPQFHFTPAKNWMNDPNGLVYLDGEYHLFFQYNPQGDTWGHMSWGHAVSPDLVHWRELTVAIPADPQYMIFSGSVVVDRDNSSGFGTAGSPPLVAIYTGQQRGGAGIQNQQLAYSNDKGRTWTKYSRNPVLDLGLKNFRDPKVFWYEPNHEWVMVAVLSDERKVTFFGSKDLKSWRHLSDFGPAGAVDGAWECPDLFALAVSNVPGEARWVLKVDVFRSAAIGSGAQYFVGSFDGRTFEGTAGNVAQPVDYGKDFYAAVSWANLPDAEHRHVWIGWMNNHGYAVQTPTAPWRGAMTLPRDVSLRSEAGTLRLVQSPVSSLKYLRGRKTHVATRQLEGTMQRLRLPQGAGNAVELQARFTAMTTGNFGIRVHVGAGQATEIGYDRARGELYVDRSQSGVIPTAEFSTRSAVPLDLRSDELKLHIWVDRSSVEVFAGDGERVLTEQVFPAPDSDGIEVFSRGGTMRIDSLDVWALESAAQTRIKKIGGGKRAT